MEGFLTYVGRGASIDCFRQGLAVDAALQRTRLAGKGGASGLDCV